MESVGRLPVSIIIPFKALNGYAIESIEHCRSLDYPNFEILALPDEISDVHLDGVRIIPTGPVGPAEKRDLAADYHIFFCKMKISRNSPRFSILIS